ncbi:MAG: hypothetical protein WC222_03565 [Parachlamydiales bacterium]|jgi:hypothetical protein
MRTLPMMGGLLLFSFALLQADNKQEIQQEKFDNNQILWIDEGYGNQNNQDAYIVDLSADSPSDPFDEESKQFSPPDDQPKDNNIKKVITLESQPPPNIEEKIEERYPVIKNSKIIGSCDGFGDCDKSIAANRSLSRDVEAEQIQESLQALEQEIVALQETIEVLSTQPSEESEALSNFLIKGSAFTNYTMLHRHNGTFETGLTPLFLWRYSDFILFEMELEIGLGEDCSTEIELEYATIDYILNDCWTIRVGKFLTPLGIVWEKMHSEWINKLPFLPLPYDPEDLSLIPKSEIGLDVRGARPLNLYFSCDCIPAVVTYDFWISNGPSEVDGDLVLGCNFEDNNRNLAFGTRMAFRPLPFREIGISGMRGQWSSNSLADDFTTKRHLYWNALVLDLNWNFNPYFRVMGEYIWTKRNQIILPEEEGDSPFYRNVVDKGFWIQASTLFGFLGCECYNSYEAVIRYAEVDRQSLDINTRRLSLGFNYYATNKLVIKNAYDINTGRTNCDNRYTIQVAYGY